MLGSVGTVAPPPQSNRELLRLAGIHLCDRDTSDPQCADADGDDSGGARIRLPMRVGRYIQMPLAYARLGPIRLVALPGEFSPELVIGVPDDFNAPDAVGRYYERPERHVVGAAYAFPGTGEPGWVSKRTHASAEQRPLRAAMFEEYVARRPPRCDAQLHRTGAMLCAGSDRGRSRVCVHSTTEDVDDCLTARVGDLDKSVGTAMCCRAATGACTATGTTTSASTTTRPAP